MIQCHRTFIFTQYFVNTLFFTRKHILKYIRKKNTSLEECLNKRKSIWTNTSRDIFKKQLQWKCWQQFGGISFVHQQSSTNNPLKNKSPERPEQDHTPITGMIFIQRKKDKGATVFRALLSLFSGPVFWESPFPSFQSMEPLMPSHQWQARGRTKRCNLEEDKNPPSTSGTAMGKLLIVYTLWLLLISSLRALTDRYPPLRSSLILSTSSRVINLCWTNWGIPQIW